MSSGVVDKIHLDSLGIIIAVEILASHVAKVCQTHKLSGFNITSLNL
jgi:hypothetical protein